MVLGHRRIAVAALGLVLVGAFTACELPLRPSFVVNSTDTLADVAPGDGVCETAPGNGTCTLPAALDEANALGVDTDLVVPSGEYPAVRVHVTGKVRINEGLRNRIEVGGAGVAAGGQLIIDGLSQFVATGDVAVDGVLVMRHSSLGGFAPQLRVGATGTAALENVTVDGGDGPAIKNDGILALRNVTVSAASIFGAGSGIETGATGTTSIESTLITWRSGLSSTPGSACLGTDPVSLGANVAWDLSCGLSQPGDQSPVAPGTTWDATGTPMVVTVTPTAGSSIVDAVPVGSHGCGEGLVDDQVGNPRPVDADLDPLTPAACDIGAIERQGA